MRGQAVHRINLEKPPPEMPVDQALELMGNPPKTWVPYFNLEAARSLYVNGLCLLAQRRERGVMVRIWKAK